MHSPYWFDVVQPCCYSFLFISNIDLDNERSPSHFIDMTYLSLKSSVWHALVLPWIDVNYDFISNLVIVKQIRKTPNKFRMQNISGLSPESSRSCQFSHYTLLRLQFNSYVAIPDSFSLESLQDLQHLCRLA